MKTETIDYTVAGHYLSALINADRSGLSDKEEKELDAFEKRAFNAAKELHGYKYCHWYTPLVDGGSFECCEIAGSFADCYPLQLVVATDTL